MSQTETFLIFALGFCAALFVVLIFGRGVFALLGSLSGWREARKKPAVILELQAERDRLKAEKAMMIQKLQTSVGDMKMRLAEQMAEVSRSRNRILQAAEALRAKDATITHLQEQLADKASLVASLETQLEEHVKTINQAHAKLAQRSAVPEVAGNPLEPAPAETFRFESPRQENTRPALVPSPTSNSFEQRFTNIIAGNPLSTPLPAPPQPVAPATPQSGAAEIVPAGENAKTATEQDRSDEVERSVSNVLSLAERLRGFQSGGKKA